MPDHISPLDERFITLGRAAMLIAKENPATSPAKVLDQFSRAIFAGEFDPPAVNLVDEEAIKMRNAPENWLHILIETPAVWLSPEQRKLSPRPVEYFGANRSTVTSVMYSMDALPGHGDQWSSMPRGHDYDKRQGRGLHGAFENTARPFSAFRPALPSRCLRTEAKAARMV